MEAFQAIKSVFSFSLKIILPYYDCTAHMTLKSDSSKKGLGSVLMQNGKPINFASRSLTKENYWNLESETLATIWGIEHFHYILYGKEFTI